MKVLDFSSFVKLRELKVDDCCFCKVEELKLIGLKALESVAIGDGCFAKHSYSTGDRRDKKYHFYLKNCPRLKSLKIGDLSFSGYSVCEIENVDALEVIEMSDSVFFSASLELKSVLIHIE